MLQIMIGMYGIRFSFASARMIYSNSSCDLRCGCALKSRIPCRHRRRDLLIETIQSLDFAPGASIRLKGSSMLQHRQISLRMLTFPAIPLWVQGISLLLNLFFLIALVTKSVFDSGNDGKGLRIPQGMYVPQQRLSNTKNEDVSTLSRHLLEESINMAKRKVFIDLGAHNGLSTGLFLGQEKGAGHGTLGGKSDSLLSGMGAGGDWHVIVVEPNYYYAPQLFKLRDRTLKANAVASFTVINGTAIATKTGNVTYIYDNNETHGDAGSTIMADSWVAFGPRFTIPSLSLVDLMRAHHIRHDDFVVLKIDIEGYEYDLLRNIITHGLHTRIDLLAVEFHENNHWVYARKPDLQKLYTERHKCLTWMMEETPSMKSIEWN